jgi:hypothetical protein
MSNVRRLGQGLWLVKNVNFTSGGRPCCQKRHLLKLTNNCGPRTAFLASRCIIKQATNKIVSILGNVLMTQSSTTSKETPGSADKNWVGQETATATGYFLLDLNTIWLKTLFWPKSYTLCYNLYNMHVYVICDKPFLLLFQRNDVFCF